MNKINKILTSIVAIALMLCCFQTQAQNYPIGSLNVIPIPKKVDIAVGQKPFLINSGTTIVFGSEQLRNEADFLCTYINELVGIKLSVSNIKPKSNYIYLNILSSKTKDIKIHPQGYNIVVNKEGINIVSSTSTGVFYGVQTIAKALPLGCKGSGKAYIEAGSIEDYPNFQYRGFMLDVGRHFFSTKYIKKLIDLLALHNLNYFHWHLTEDQGWRIEIKKYPKLTSIASKRDSTRVLYQPAVYEHKQVSGFYTQEEAIDIVKYAESRHITVIPEIDLPGHMSAALVAYPELGCTGGPYNMPCEWGVFADVLCGGNPKTIQFAKDVLNEIMDIFPSKYIHIGGDECPKDRWKQCQKCQNKIKELGIQDMPHKTKENQLQTYFMDQIGQVIKSRGRQMMGWDEMLEGGLAPESIVMCWTNPAKSLIETANQNHYAIACPIQYLYFSNPNYNRLKSLSSIERVYNYDIIPKDLSKDKQPYIMGTQACIWTEWTRDSLKMEWQLLPRLAALSEQAWATPSQKNFINFTERLPHMLSLYNALGYYYRPDIWNADIVVNEGNVSIRALGNATIYYTTDGSDPYICGKVYTSSFKADKGTVIKAVAVRNGIKTAVITKEL